MANQRALVSFGDFFLSNDLFKVIFTNLVNDIPLKKLSGFASTRL